MKKYFWFLFLTLLLFFSLATRLFAGNVQITNFGPSGYDATTGLVTFRADFAWSKAWRNEINHDALWVFMKIWVPTSGVWRHATMSASGINPTGFSAKGGYEIIVPEDKAGFFLRIGPGQASSTAQTVDTSTMGNGSVTFTWDYLKARQAGIAADLGSSSTKFRLFAIEMVYVPEGSFMAGDASSTAAGATYGFQYGFATTSADPPGFSRKSGWPIDSESAINLPSFLGGNINVGPHYYYKSGSGGNESATGAAFTIPSEFPKGYKAFYLMKTEISQGQYRDFLNTLSRDEYQYRCAGAQTPTTTGRYCDSVGTGAGSSARQGVRYISSTAYTAGTNAFACAMSSATGNDGSDDGEWVAMNYLSWMDLAAYLEWAGLRPITELEFEKAARGPAAPITADYPWGNTTDPTATSSYTALNSATEVGDGLAAEFDSAAGTWPVRVGSFANTAALDTSPYSRGNSGAGYYGNLDLAGNVWEMVINVGTPVGREFQGSHGQGFLHSSNRGNADRYDWPGMSNIGVASLSSGGVGVRGGSWFTALSILQTSNRSSACSSAWVATRTNDVGGRGGRTAPTFAAPTKPQ
ncbi:MAG TPA: SUMF1/EgtB/PvdO family nonheme iron enzyme [Candidatus Omnitrophota bacterium]|nr:SUMF1/EgtB/PvdO family nonheme iron enzyme [Candidatus Omnitrophota bacterium]